jgi:hypothetical protein
VELIDYSLWAAPLALTIALVALVWRRWVLPLLLGLVAVPLGAVVGRLAWEWFADPPPGTGFGSELEDYDWVIGFASAAALIGVLTGVWWSARRLGDLDRH